MGESFLRTWEDADAPGLVASNGAFTDLLQAVLVDGYGSKPGLGWTAYFSGTNKKVFKNEGTETLVRFDHSQEANFVYVRGYESMTDIDNGVLPCPGETFTGNYVMLKSAATEPANVVPWRILGDDKGIWIATSPTYADAGGYTTAATDYWKFVYVGDYIPFDLTNVHHNFCFLTASINNHYAERCWFEISSFKDVKDSYWARRDINMLPGSVQLGLGSGSSYETTMLGDSAGLCEPDSQIQLTSIPMIHSSNGIVGRIPGLKNSLTKRPDAFTPATYAQKQIDKPEMSFDQGGYKEHFWTAGYTASTCMYMVFTEGKGFRNVI